MILAYLGCLWLDLGCAICCERLLVVVLVVCCLFNRFGVCLCLLLLVWVRLVCFVWLVSLFVV